MLYNKFIRSVIAICCLLVSTFMLASCSPQESIKIGFVAALTGSSSEISVNGRNAVYLAVEEINHAGGIKGKRIELHSEDDKNDKKIALHTDKHLAQHGVTAIIGHMTSGMAELTVPFVNEQNILMISPTISLDSLAGIDDNFVRVISSNKLQGDFLAKMAFKTEKVKKVAVIYDRRNEAFAEPVKSFFAQGIKSYGGQIVITEVFENGNSGEYSAIVKRINDADADGILLIASSVDAAMICQQFLKQEIKLPIFMPMWSMTNDLIKQGGPAVEGTYLINIIDFESSAPDFVKFKKDYYERYGAEATFASILSYEAAKVLFESMNHAQQLTAASIKEALLKKRIFKGLQGDIVIDQYGDTNRDFHLYRVKDGAFVKVEE